MTDKETEYVWTRYELGKSRDKFYEGSVWTVEAAQFNTDTQVWEMKMSPVKSYDDL